jgi:hypothetical protein
LPASIASRSSGSVAIDCTLIVLLVGFSAFEFLSVA